MSLFNIYYHNCNRIATYNLQVLQSDLLKFKREYDVIVLLETHFSQLPSTDLKRFVSNIETDYHVFCNDNDSGIAAFVPKHKNSNPRLLKNTEENTMVISVNGLVLFIAYFRPYQTVADNRFLENFEKLVRDVAEFGVRENNIIIGDLNFKCIYKNGIPLKIARLNRGYTRKCYTTLVKFLDDNHYVNANIIPNQRGNFLDILFLFRNIGIDVTVIGDKSNWIVRSISEEFHHRYLYQIK